MKYALVALRSPPRFSNMRLRVTGSLKYYRTARGGGEVLTVRRVAGVRELGEQTFLLLRPFKRRHLSVDCAS